MAPSGSSCWSGTHTASSSSCSPLWTSILLSTGAPDTPTSAAGRTSITHSCPIYDSPLPACSRSLASSQVNGSGDVKGIVTRVLEWTKMILVEGSKVFTLTEAYSIFSSFWQNFHVLFIKKHALVVSHLRVTLQMMSNNCRSLSFIGFLLVQFILQ